MRLRPAFLASLVLGVLPVPVAGQALVGRAFDAVTGQGIQGVEVAVLDPAGRPVGLAVSDSAGVFGAALAEAGRFRVVATAPGYDSLAVDSLVVGLGEEVRIELRLGPRPLDVEALTVVARQGGGSLALRDFYRRLDREGRTGRSGRGLVLGPDVLDGYAGVTAAGVLARESLMVREVTGLRSGVALRGRGARPLGPEWCRPAIFLDGLPVDAAALRSIPAQWLVGIEVYRDLMAMPAEYSWVPEAGSCGVVLAWTRRGGPDREGPVRPFRTGAYLAGVTSDRQDGSLDFGGLGVELELGLARSTAAWLEVGILRRDGGACVAEVGTPCDEGVPWSAVLGGSLFFSPDSGASVTPFIGAGFGLGAPAGRVRGLQLWRLGLELGIGPLLGRVELRAGTQGWGGGLALLF